MTKQQPIVQKAPARPAPAPSVQPEFELEQQPEVRQDRVPAPEAELEASR